MSDENRQMDHKVVFEPYDMDTALGTNNSGVLMFSPYLEDTDTVSSVIAGGDSGGSEAPVYNAQDSVLWNNLRDAFRSELVQMYRNLRASNGPWQYNAIEKRFEDHQAIWPEAIFNEDAWVKYIIPLVDPVTVDDDTGELIRTDRYLTMLQGSKKEQRKWWLYNRLRYLDSKYDTGNASSNIINIRFFNGGTLKLKTAIPMYAAVSFGGGTTPEIKRTEANTEVSFTYVPGTGVTEMETWIHSGNLITDVGDLSVFYPNECDFSKASLLKRLKIGDSTSGYSNANLTTINVRNSPLLEYIDCRNCPRLGITVNLENSPRLAEAYFDGTSITGLDLADGCAIETLHLPATVTALTLLNLTKLNEFVIPSYANIARFMFDNIDTTVVNPISVLSAIRPNSQVNIQGLYLELADAEAIGDFFDLVDTMSGVTRERSTITGEWIYHNEEKAVIAGEVHTEYLTGDEMEVLNARYPYVRTTADHITTTLKYYNWDGSTLLETQTIIDGGDGTYSGTPTRADDADWRYTFIGWNTQPDKYVADPNATLAVNQNRSVYAAYSRTSIAVLKYYNYDGSELLYSETIIGGGNGIYAGQPTRDSTAQYSYSFTGWSLTLNGQADVNAQKSVTTHRSVYAAYSSTVRTYTVTFMNGATVLQTFTNVPYGSSVTYTGEEPINTDAEDPTQFAFGGWNPDGTNITGTTVCQPIFIDLTIKIRKLIDGTISGTYENSLVTMVKDTAFYGRRGLSAINLENASTIGATAFGLCTTLSVASFENVKVIKENAFYSLCLKSIYVPNVETIFASAFYSCSGMKSFSAPKLTSISSYAFASCYTLKEFYAPSLQLSGGAFYCFANCYALSSVNIDAAVSINTTFASCEHLESLSLPNVTSIGGNTFDRCYRLRDVSLPKVNYIGYQAFLMCENLSSIYLPSLTSMSSQIFSQCVNLKTVRFGPYLSRFTPSFLFTSCYNLEAVILEYSSGVCSTNNSIATMFDINSKLKVYVPDSLVSDYRSAGTWSTYSSRIFGIEDIPSTYTKSVVSGEGISVLENAYRSNYSLQEAVFPFATEVQPQAFRSCYCLENISMPNLEIIGASAFEACKVLKNVELPNVSEINQCGFYGCHNLVSFSASKLQSVAMSAFAYCQNLEYVNLGSLSILGSSAFEGCHNLVSIVAPDLSRVHENTFKYCANLSSIELKNASYIHGSAFYVCGLEYVSLPSCKTIYTSAFAYNTRLKTLYLPKLTSLSHSVFEGCINIESIYLGYSLAYNMPIYYFTGSIKNPNLKVYVRSSIASRCASSWSGWLKPNQVIPYDFD